MDVAVAAGRWASTWERSWPHKDIEAIVALYAEDTVYRALAFREPDLGTDGVRRYLTEQFAVEHDIECRFGIPVISGDRAAVEWWASWIEEGAPITLAGSTFLRFDPAGLVIDHRDYWSHVDRSEPPHHGW